VRRLEGGAPEELPPAERAALLAQVKAVPVVFVTRPRHRTEDPVAREWRRELEQSELPGRVLARLLHAFRRHPAFLREVLLSESYLYASKPALGVTLAEAVTPGLLFREPRIVIERGAERLHADRDEQGSYSFADGPDAGKPARLLLFDRVYADGDEPGDPLHLDLAPLRRQRGFDSLSVDWVTDAGMVGTAHWGERGVPVLLARRGAQVALECAEAGTPSELVRDRLRLSRSCQLDELARTVGLAVDEALPFDEPRTEFGQEDGKLRQRWREAYRQRAGHYEFNGDKYAVFDSQGRPLVPEVCIDFIVDTFERAGGTWYASRTRAPERLLGRIDFDTAGMENRRNVEEFLALAERRPDWFELRMAPPEERVPLERRDRFFATLFQHRAEYQRGDIVVILGERADEKLHYHSFFVFDTDPVTGMPTLVAGNSGRPRVRAWAAEMASAPKRSVFARVRPGWALLRQISPSCERAPVDLAGYRASPEAP
jgi:hypothetical protein